MKFFSVALLLALFCAVTVSAAPSPLTDEITLFEEEPFGLIDAITNAINKMIQRSKCFLDSIGETVGQGKLKPVYQKYRADVDKILNNDVVKCMETKGFIERIKCSLVVTQKLNKLDAAFLKEVIKVEADVAEKMYKAYLKCARKQVPFMSNEDSVEQISDEESTLFEEESFGLIDAITKIINNMIEMSKCFLDNIGKTVGQGKLKPAYQKYRAAVDKILNNDVVKCMETKGFVERVKCSLVVRQKLNKLNAEFLKEAIKVETNIAVEMYKVYLKCSRKQAPFISNEELFELQADEDEFALLEEESFGIVDEINKAINKMIETMKCTLDAFGTTIKDGKLKAAYKKYRTDVDKILNKDVVKCMETKGLVERIKCSLTVRQKLNKLNAAFLKEAIKVEKNLREKFYAAFEKCAKKKNPKN